MTITRRQEDVVEDVPRRGGAAPTFARERWARRYARGLVVIDVIIVVVSLLAAAVFGSQPHMLPLLDGRVWVPVGIPLAVLAAAMLVTLSSTGSRVPRVFGVGSREYRAVLLSVMFTFAGVALVAYVTSLAGLHAILAIGGVSTGVGLVAGRWLARRWLVAQRRRGRMSHKVLVVGDLDAVEPLVRDLQKVPGAGLHVVGSYDPDGFVSPVDSSATPRATAVSVVEALELLGADTVLISSANELSPATVRELSWQLEPGRQHLVVAPSLTDVGGPRIHSRPVAGLPLLHVETPRYDGGRLHVKRAFDIVASASLILLLSPLLIAIAFLVRGSSPGGALFRQERVGLKGRTFAMLKFRSMYVDAEERLAELRAADTGNGVMFKMKDDPRVTAVGSVLRRFSLDELPQLFNVLSGSMSLVGPRPPLGREVELYGRSVHRRFLVKPGITGLWQVSGRSDLDWDETVRLDLFYVENWTLTGDLAILFKTVRAVVRREGAY
ncbi:sugar transferase [Microbacterium sp. LMI1-1-1.1]|uniref:sugar transferase n=1 Tax=Microbacterium sp. LMI1-1-1.1 TaxID=3135223 RepID=UPI003467C437